ncbi:MAG: hypothetical protein HXY41_07525 [Chloroflexi bacterium]|nr:hypothetical protein [Chloroflexota bacterium]
MAELNDGLVETPVPGLEVQRRHDGRMVIFTFKAHFNARILDTWMALLKSYLEERQTTDRYMVYDVSQTQFLVFTSLANQRLKEVAAAYPDATGRVAVIVPRIGVLQPIGEFFVQHNNNRLQPNLDIRMFNDRQEGINWVLAGMPDEV